MTKSIHLQGIIARANMTVEWKLSMKLFVTSTQISQLLFLESVI